MRGEGTPPTFQNSHHLRKAQSCFLYRFSLTIPKPTMKRLLCLFATLGFTSAVLATVETYKIDPVHSSVSFSIRLNL